MNKIFRVIWNRTLGRLVVTSELAHGQVKASSSGKPGAVQPRLSFVLNPFMTLFQHNAVNTVASAVFLASFLSCLPTSAVAVSLLDGTPNYNSTNNTGETSIGISIANSIAAGTTSQKASALADGSVAIGPGASVSAAGKNGLAIGNGAKVETYTNSSTDNAKERGNVAIGSGSIAYAPVKTSNANVDGLTTTAFAGAAPPASFSIGNQKDIAGGGFIFTRHLQGVAAGQITSTSTDGVNGSQLYAVMKLIPRYISIKSTASGTDSNQGNDGASGTDAIAIGASAKAQAGESLAIGKSTQVTAAGGVAIGGGFADGSTSNYHGATVSVANGIALGRYSNSNRELNPTDTNATNYSIGYDPLTGIASTNSTATWKANNGALAIGNSDGTQTRQITGVAAGHKDTDAVNVAQLKNAQIHYFHVHSPRSKPAQGDDIGNRLNNGVHSTSLDAIAIGAGARVGSNAHKSVVIGYGAEVRDASLDGTNGISPHKNSVVIGYLAKAYGSEARNAVALGPEAHSGGLSTISIGHKSETSSNKSVALGAFSKTSASTAMALGYGAQSAGQYSVAIGMSEVPANWDEHRDTTGVEKPPVNVTQASGIDSIAIGRQALAGGLFISDELSGDDRKAAIATANAVTDAIAIGREAQSKANYAISLGKSTQSTKANAVAIGYHAQATGAASLALGGGTSTAENLTKATADYAMALGNSAQATAQHAIAVGNGAKSSAQDALALGHSASASAQDTLALGRSASVSQQYGVAIGQGAQVSVENGIALGRYANSNRALNPANGTNLSIGYDPNTSTAIASNNPGAAWKATVGVALAATLAKSQALPQVHKIPTL